MIGAERFIEKLAEQGALSESVIKRLRNKVAGSSSVPSARALAQFLMDKGYLTREQADEALAASAPPRRERKPKKERPAAEKARTRKEKAPRKRSRTDEIDPFAAPEEPTAAKGGKSKRKYKKKTKGDNEFDTPLMLLGGGGLVLMLLSIGGLLYLFFAESGDERLKAARDAYEAGSYAQAIQDYEYFVENFAAHEGFGKARVTLGIARIRQIVDSNSEQGLNRAKTEIPEIEDFEAFTEAQEDLAGLLPRMATDLADKADAAEGLEDIRKYVDLTEQALVLCNNASYVPPRLRDKQEIAQIKEVLARIGLRQIALENLESTLATMGSAVTAGDTKTAYAAHAAFVKDHPEKAGDEALLEAVAKASQAEKAGIKYVEEAIAGLTEEPPTAVAASVATADQRRKAAAPAAGVSVVRFQGAAYAISQRDGSLLWRRPLGASLTPVMPVMVGDDCLLVDSKRKEVVRVNAATGKLVWRAPVDDTVAEPLLLGNRVLAAGESGRLHVIDAASGTRIGFVQFAQPLRSKPAYYAERQRVYLVGEHSSVYSLDASDLSCLGVFYLGHAKGAVTAPPASVLNRLVVFENDGAATSSLHLFGLDENGIVTRRLVSKEEPETRLPGLTTGKAEVFGKRFAVMTDSGHIGVYEVSSEDTDKPLSLLGTRAARRQPRSTRYSAVVNQELWVGGSGLARYSIQPAGSRLPARDVKDQFRGDTFVHPLEVSEGVIVHVRRRRGRAGATVSATDVKTGAVYWETDIAAPASGPPVASRSAGGLLVSTALGRIFLVDRQALSTGVTSRVVGGDGSATLDTGDSSVATAVYASSTSGRAIGVGTGSQPIRPMNLPGGLACPPVPFGKGWLAMLSVGQVYLFDPTNGEALAAPFQPLLTPQQAVRWQEPAVVESGKEPWIVVCDGERSLYTLNMLSSPAPHLAPIAVHESESGRLISRVAADTENAAVGSDDAQLRFFKTSTLEPTGAAKLTSSIVWGPHAVAGAFLVATADNKLVCLDPSAPDSPRWSMDIAATALVGRPLAEAQGEALLTMRTGRLVRRSLETGEVTLETEIGQTLAYGGSPVSGRLALASTDGALLLVARPEAR